MKQKILTFLVFIFTLNLVLAQKKDSLKINDFYFNLGLGGMTTIISPEYNTSLPYSGFNGDLYLGMSHYIGKIYYSITENFAGGILNSYKTQKSQTLSAYNIHNNFEISCMYNSYVFKNPEIKLYTGLQISNMISTRMKQSNVANSSVSYLASFSVDLALMAEYDFSLNSICKKACCDKNFSLNFSISNPIWAVVYFPPYIGVSEDLLNENSSMIDFNSNYQSVLTKFVNLQTNLQLKYKLENGNIFSLSYARTFISSKSDLSTIKMLNNSIIVSLLVNLN